MEKKKNVTKLQEQKAITLIALVITIVVMLILAGVTINLTLGENGIFTTAQKAVQNYTDAQNKEMADLNDFTNLVNNTINGLGEQGNTGGTGSTEQKVTRITLNKASTTIEVGNTETLEAVIAPDNATNKNVTWTSSDQSIATVENGTITALKAGETTITVTAQDGSGVSASCIVTVFIEGKLTDIITGSDYGKAIDYSVTVDGTTLSNWRVFYNDKETNNVYIILDEILDNNLIPEETGMTITETNQAYWSTDKFSSNEEVVATLTNRDIWKAFAAGITGATATGGPTNEMFVNSWNNNPAVNSRILTAGQDEKEWVDESKLYLPYKKLSDEYNEFYWIASTNPIYKAYIWYVHYSGALLTTNFDNSFSVNCFGVRPLVCLPSAATGRITSSVVIDK